MRQTPPSLNPEVESLTALIGMQSYLDWEEHLSSRWFQGNSLVVDRMNLWVDRACSCDLWY